MTSYIKFLNVIYENFSNLDVMKSLLKKIVEYDYIDGY